MQKKLLSLVMMGALYNVGYAEDVKDRVPVVTDAQHAENVEKAKTLGKEIDALKAQEDLKKDAKDKIELQVHNYNARKKFQESFIKELRGESQAINNYKTTADKAADKLNSDLKQADHGAAGWSGFAEPFADSRSAKEYARADTRTNGIKTSNTKLAAEHVDYKNNTEKDILPDLNKALLSKITTMENHFVSFMQCNCYSGAEYDKCLDEEGITTTQRSKDFPSQFIARAYRGAYEKAIKNGIPFQSEKEFCDTVKVNMVTKDAATKAAEKQEILTKTILRESLNPVKPDVKQPAGTPQEKKPEQK